MERNKLVVTINPVNPKDFFENRVLTLSSEKDEIVIGRSSKVPSKDLNPARNNAFFDSRVMSRSHALISACLQKKQVSISDTESMHGTWLNGKKLINNEKTLLGNLDVLKFGTKVTRGSETFEPLEVRISLSWIKEVKPAPADPPKSSQRQSVNTFVVPDDDDDEDKDFDDLQAEAIFAKPFDIEPLLLREPSVSVSVDSDVISIRSSNDDGEQQGKSSPPSSPPSRSEEKDDDARRPEQDVASQRPVSDVQTAPTLVENDNLYDAESGDEHSEVSQEDLYSSSDTKSERLEIGVKAKCNSGSVLPQNDNTGANENTGNTTKSASSNSAELLTNVYAPRALFEKFDRSSQQTDRTSQLEYPRPATSIQNLPKSGDCDDNRYSAFKSLNVSKEQANTLNPSSLGYKPSQTEQNRRRDRNFTLGSKRAASPSDKALARPAMSDSYYSLPEDNPSGRWAPASNKNHQAFGNPGSIGLESPAELFGGLPPATSSDYLFPHLPPLRLPYSDGPFTASNEEDNNWLDDSDYARDQSLAENTRDPYRFGSPFSPAPSQGPFSSAAYPDSPRHQAQSLPQSKPQRLQTSQAAGDGSSHPAQPKSANTMPTDRKKATSIPIANIVDGHKKVTELNPPANPLKRKADKLNPEAVPAEISKNDSNFYSGDGWDDGDDSFLDAQLQDFVISPGVASQLATINSTTHIESQDIVLPTFSTTRTNETAHSPPQAKKIKIETPDARHGAEPKSSFTRYAASALLGAAVGGISVVAALASLPPDFFN
ncbi:hypothetical protein GX51_05850 [Blastomyces parvus]|uniref:FHA domain-containing protein n=1 Tax=Blastomyces parvus TaxID=2060905 RepID=A0A2B7WV26_9EURO|nr:hypothetical protein GX51_05850 [Blastomyces parvus]